MLHDSGIRIDKWLCFARFFKNRTISTRIVSQGKVRLNGKRVVKPSTLLKRGDGLTFSQGNILRVIRVLGLANCRGPAKEAVLLYEEMVDSIKVKEVVYSGGVKFNISHNERSSKPSKKQRREILNLKMSYLVDY